MKKRVIALISAVVLIVSCFAVPTFAASEDYDSEYRITPYVADISAYNTGSVYNFASLGAVLINGYGIFADSLYSVTYTNVDVCLNSSGVLYLSFSNSVSGSADKFFVYGGSAKHQIYWTIGSSGAYFAAVTIRFNAASVSVSDQELFDLVFPNFYPSFTEEDLNNAYDEGYQAGISSTDPYQNGFADGAASIDQDSIRQEGYDDGYDVGFGDGAASIDQESIRQEGYDTGYDEGYLDGTEFYKDLFNSATINIFRNCSLKLTLLYWPSGLGNGLPYSVMLNNVPINFGEGHTVVFSDITDFAFNKVLLQYPEATYDMITVGSIMFEWSMFSENMGAFSFLVSDQINYTYPINLYVPIIYGYVDGSYASYRGSSYSSNNQKFFGFSNIPEGFTVSAFSVDFGSSVNYSLENFSSFEISADINIVSDVYKEGYVNGYFDGENAEFAEVKKESYNEGYNFGFSAGKKEGLKISETGDWKNLMLAVTEAPINTFQSLFNFEILGLDMRLAFGSILAVCVLLIIVKKVLL